MRYVVLDTETTGLNVDDGHRVIEIGCVEIENRSLTGREYHQKINPVPVKNPQLLKLNHELIDYFGLDKDALESNLGVSI